jgi:hypothetical protein
MVEATNLCRLHPTSSSYIYKVFYNINMPLMDFWVRPYTVIAVFLVMIVLESSWGLGDAKWYYGVMIEANKSLRMHHTCISYV